MSRLIYDVYIAGAMHGRKVSDVLLERNIAKSFCRNHGLKYYDPAEDEGLDKLNPTDIIDAKPNIKSMQWYVEKDEKAVDSSRILLVLTGDKSSSGTAWEMARMYYKWKRPIIIVAPKMASGELTNFTTIKATKIVSTIYEAVEEIQHKLFYEEDIL